MAFALSLSLTAVASAATYYVDNQNPASTDAGPGTAATPYRTISAAVTQRGGAGNTIIVHDGTYRERVVVGASGGSGAPFVIRASGPGVVVEGTSSFATAGQWTSAGGDVWLASTVTSAPAQVFADGQRLAASTASPAALPARSFVFVAGAGLYVNVGGGNPGTHGTLVGRYPYGFQLTGRSWVVISGFEIRRSDTKGIFADHTSNCEFRDNRVSLARGFGIHVLGGSNAIVAGNVVFDSGDHGIALIGGVTNSSVRDNESYRNARPTARAANGIHLFASTGNRLERNRVHDNQDTGIQISSASNGTVSIQNRVWNNGDHGFDHLSSTGAVHIGDVSYGNLKDGFSFEGGSTNGRMYDCISVNNGLNTNASDLLVDLTSTAGFVSDYDLLWNSTTKIPIRFGDRQFTSVAAFAAGTGNEVHGITADPRFVNPVLGDFHLQPGSPAIDAATSAPTGWPARDAEGRERFDDVNQTNRGTGPVTFADLGALEFVGTSSGNQLPIAALVVRPATGNAPLEVVADASGSRDPDGNIVSYRFDFGDGTSAGPQSAPTARHTYAAGTWNAKVTVQDDDGATSTATFQVKAGTQGNLPPVAVLVVTPALGKAPLEVVADASRSKDLDGSIVSYRFDFGDGTVIGPQSAPTARHTYRVGTWVARVQVTDNRGATGSAPFPVAVLPDFDRTPVIKVASNVSIDENKKLVLDLTVSDPDSGQSIASLTADLSGLPTGHNALFTKGTGNKSGRLTWTPSHAHAGKYTVRFEAKNSLTAKTSTIITVNNVDRAPVIVGPSSIHAEPGETIAFTISVSDPDGDKITKLVADFSRMPSGSGATFTPNASNTGGTFRWRIPGSVSGNFHPRFKASNALSASHQTNIHVRDRDKDDDDDDIAASGPATDEAVVTELALSPGHPNPSSTTVAFGLDLPRAAMVRWAVYDLQGRSVWSEERSMSAGRGRLAWEGADTRGQRVAKGLYLVRVRVDGKEFTRRVTRF